MIALLEARRAGLLTRAHLPNNIVAGLVVGIVAMPLAMAFAIASGATPAQGLYTAIVAGLATSLLGGTRVQISGPTGAFIAVLAGVTAQFGIAGLQAATLMAGVILLVLGIARLGGVIRFIPSPVIVGFTAGIAVIIWVGQWKDFFGLHPATSGLHFHEKFIALLNALWHPHLATTLIGARYADHPERRQSRARKGPRARTTACPAAGNDRGHGRAGWPGTSRAWPPSAAPSVVFRANCRDSLGRHCPWATSCSSSGPPSPLPC